MSDDSPITWVNGTRKLKDLIPWEYNPRYITESQAEQLELSLIRFGLAYPFLIQPDNQILDGHQRGSVLRLMDMYSPESDVDVRISSRPLTEQERRELIIRLHENIGSWNYDMLPNLYEPDELVSYGMPQWKLDNIIEPPEPPESFAEYGDDIDTEYCCPKCGYEWSGSPT